MSHSIILLLVIIGVIITQIFFFRKAKEAISEYKDIFKIANYKKVNIYIPVSTIQTINVSRVLNNIPLYTTPEAETECVEIYILSSNSENRIFKLVLKTINNYLIKNKGAVSDFNLIKDIADRHIDAEEESIRELQPIPLYCGLGGTMLGIIIGVAYLSITGALTEMLNPSIINEIVSTSAAAEGVNALIWGVAIAMISSFMGLVLTIVLSYKIKKSKFEIEQKKNVFFAWFQSELLPYLASNSTSAIATLQSNLLSFNQVFKENAQKIDNSLGQVATIASTQSELIESIEKLDVQQMASANVRVLKELNSCVRSLGDFNHYAESTNRLYSASEGYIQKVSELSNHIEEHLNRTKAVEELGSYFKKINEEFDSKKNNTAQVIADIDEHLKKSYAEIQEFTQVSIDKIKDDSSDKIDSLKSNTNEIVATIDEQLSRSYNDLIIKSEKFINQIKDDSTLNSEALKKQNESQMNFLKESITKETQAFQEFLTQQQQQLTTLISDPASNFKELKLLNHLPTLVSSIQQLSQISVAQNNKLDQLDTSIKEIQNIDVKVEASAPETTVKNEKPLWIKIGEGVTLALLSAASITVIFSFVESLLSK